jgi:hypothetical protein
LNSYTFARIVTAPTAISDHDGLFGISGCWNCRTSKEVFVIVTGAGFEGHEDSDDKSFSELFNTQKSTPWRLF